MQTLSTALVALLALVLGGGALAFIAQAEPHHTLGTWSELAMPTLVTIVAIVIACALAGFGAWLLWTKEHKMAAQLLGILAAILPILIWKGADAANVVLDGSQPETYATEVVERRTNKGRNLLVVKSHRDPEAELLIDISALGTGHELAPGQAATVTVRAGAFGRPYVTKLEPR